MKLSLAALPLRTRPDFETSRALCGLAQNSAHSELTPNFAAQAAANLLLGVVLQCQRIRICWLVQFALVEHLDLLLNNPWLLVGNRPIRLIHQELALAYQTNCAGVTNLKIVTTNHGRQWRGAHQLTIACQLA
ncbi:hypothetical protein ACFQHW_02735 [Lapidilactobacillus achengensis]|uniref:Uncharacterized protein n=2 Tax=Lapidilactobacillus achengensis TaxID=2486000 RepID=A0ABW1UKL3_9LACO